MIGGHVIAARSKVIMQQRSRYKTGILPVFFYLQTEIHEGNKSCYRNLIAACAAARRAAGTRYGEQDT